MMRLSSPKFASDILCRGLAGLALLSASVHPARAEIGIGIAVPLSGIYSSLGEQIVSGASFAAKEWNARQNDEKNKLLLHPVDDKCDAEIAKDVANQLIGKGVAFVIGHLCDRASIETTTTYFNNQVVQISPGSQNPNFTDNRPSNEGGTYRLAARNTQQADTISEFLLSLEDPRIAIVNDGSVFGKGLADSLVPDLEEAGIDTTLLDDFEAGEERYRRLAGRIVDSGADTVFIGAGHLDAAVLIRDLDRLNRNLQIIGPDSFVHQEFPSLVLTGNDNRTDLRNIFVSFTPDPRKFPSAKKAVERLEEAEVPAIGLTLRGYAAVEIITQTIANSQRRSYQGYNETLNSRDFETVLGPLSFDADGDSHLIDYLMHEWRGNTIVPLPPKPLSE